MERDLNATPEEKKQLLIGSSAKKKDRYKVITDEGKELLFKTRNEVISGELVNYTSYANSNSYYCTRDYDYVYIEKDIHMGRIEGSNCKNIQPVYNFHPLKHPQLCERPACTLCGHMSIGLAREDLEVKVNEEY